MSFEHPWVLYSLIALVPLVYLAYRSFCLFGRFERSPEIKIFFISSRLPSPRRRWASLALRMLTLSLLVAALANPQVELPSNTAQYKNVRVIFLADVSLSMVYAEDIHPNRLLALKGELKGLINDFGGSYETAIIPFAGNANPYYCPFTYSKKTLAGLIDTLSADVAPALGTNINSGFEVIEKFLVKYDKIDKEGVNLVVLLTDGGKEEALVKDRDKLLTNIRKLSAQNFRVYTVGIGGTEPTPLLVRDRQGDFLYYLTDDKNRVWHSELDEEILRQIAEAGNGKYFNFKEVNKLKEFLQEAILETRLLAGEQTSYNVHSLRNYFFAVAALCLWGVFLLKRI